MKSIPGSGYPARQRIEQLGFFEEVRISTPEGAKPDTLDMKVDVVEQPTGSFSVGAGLFEYRKLHAHGEYLEQLLTQVWATS